jgi:hypothetical protein
MPFYDDFQKIFWQVLLAFILSMPLYIITSDRDKAFFIFIYVIGVFVCIEMYFLIKWIFVYSKEKSQLKNPKI